MLHRFCIAFVFIISSSSFAQIFIDDFGVGDRATNTLNYGAETDFRLLLKEQYDNKSPLYNEGLTSVCPITQGPNEAGFVVLSSPTNSYYGQLSCDSQNNLMFDYWHQNLRDHSTSDGTGKYMLVNGTGDKILSSQIIYSIRRTVEPNEEYRFSAWIANVLKQNSCENDEKELNIALEVYYENPFENNPVFKIETKDISGFVGSSVETPENIQDLWQKANLDFTPTEKYVYIVLRDLGGNGCGNDYAVDDIVLRKKGEEPLCQLESIYYEISDRPRVCGTNIVEISTTSPVPGAWKASGIYDVTIMNPSSKTTTVVIPYSKVIYIEWIPELTECQVVSSSVNNRMNLRADPQPKIESISSTSEGCGEADLSPVTNLNSSLRYKWSTEDGVMSSSEFSRVLTVSSVGTYTLEVTAINSECVDTMSYTLTTLEDPIEIPSLEINNFNCWRELATIEAIGGSEGDNFKYKWNTVYGKIESGVESKKIEVSTTGKYTLTITDEVTSCSKSISANVIEYVTPKPGNDFNTYANNSNILGDISFANDDIQWYADSSGDETVSPYTVIREGEKYYAAQTIDGCESKNRTEITGFSELFSEDFGTGFEATNELQNGAVTNYDLLGKGGWPAADPSSKVPLSICPINEGPNDGEFLILSLKTNDYYGQHDFCSANNLFFSGWYQEFEDHTPNDSFGRFMIINGKGNKEGNVFYQRTISGLKIDESYELSMFVMNLLNPYTSCAGFGTLEEKVHIAIEIYDGSNTSSAPLTVLDSEQVSSFNSSAKNISSKPTKEQLYSLWTEMNLVFNTRSKAVTIVMKDYGNQGCGNDFAIDDIVLRPSQSLGLSKFNSFKVGFEPNPVEDVLTITSEETISQIEVFSFSGQNVLSQKGSGKTALLDMSSLTSGMYIVKVYGGTFVETIKVIKE